MTPEIVQAPEGGGTLWTGVANALMLALLVMLEEPFLCRLVVTFLAGVRDPLVFLPHVTLEDFLLCADKLTLVTGKAQSLVLDFDVRVEVASVRGCIAAFRTLEPAQY